MATLKNSDETGAVIRRFKELVSAPALPFPKFGYELPAPKKHGVYIIYSPRGNVLHVGRTYRNPKGMWQRLRNHLQGKSSFVEKHFDKDGSKLRNGYSFGYVVVGQRRERFRALLEAYATGCLCPAHIGTGAALSADKNKKAK